MNELGFLNFSKYMENIRLFIRLQDAMDGMFRDYNSSTKSDACISLPALVDDVVDLLTLMTKDEAGWIEYYIFELDFGKKYHDGSITDVDGNIIKLKTLDDLWNVLLAENQDGESVGA